MSQRELTLIISGLFANPQQLSLHAFNQFRGWREFFRQADYVPGHETNLDTLLCKLFQIKPEPADALPIAALRACSEHFEMDSSTWVMAADPLFLQADQKTVHAVDTVPLQITDDETKELLTLLNAFLEKDDLKIVAHSPAHWYFFLPTDPQIRSVAINALAHQDLNACLPKGLQQHKWRKLLTELQMLLHQSDVNQRRHAQGQPLINSLWFWGVGRLPTHLHCEWQVVWSDFRLARDLAYFAKKGGEQLPPNINYVFDVIDASRNFLVVVNQLQESKMTVNSEQWNTFIKKFDEDWIQPALAAIKINQLATLKIYTENGACFTVTKEHLRRWWNTLPWKHRKIMA